MDGYKVNDDIIPYSENKPMNTEKLNNQYIKRYVNGMAYTIGGNQDANEMQINLMG